MRPKPPTDSAEEPKKDIIDIMGEQEETPWYKDGLRFTCSQCGNCCTGAPGFVWVNEDEIADLARVVGISSDEFEKKYVRKVGIRQSLVEFSNGDCVFFDNKTRGCTVYEARPRQCRTWPFWDSNIKTEGDWKETCQSCPGSGKGQLYTVEEILERSSRIRL